MPDGQSLEFSGVTKRFGAITAVSGLTAQVEPGRVTGFLGPNGAGKTTTLRILLGLVRATDGHATIGGQRYADLAHPLQTVGAVLEASSFHPGRTAAAHLKVYAQAAKIGNSRVDEVLGLVGLTDAAGRKVGGFSLGMRQRLGLAYALLGDPGVLVLDEPANGLDPEGIRWMRGLLRELAREGRTVLVSSHLLAEVQQTVDALLVISQGRLVFQGSLHELSDPSEHATVVDAPDRAALSAALAAAAVPFEVLRSGLTVRGVERAAVGAAAAAAGVALSSLHRRGPALEEVFLDLVNGVRVHPSASAAGAVAGVVTEESAPVAETDAAAQPGEQPEAADEPDPETSRLARSSLAQQPEAEPAGPAAVDVDVAASVVDPAGGEPAHVAETAEAAAEGQPAEPAEPAESLERAEPVGADEVEQPTGPAEPAEADQLAMTDPAHEGAEPSEESTGTAPADSGSAAFAVASTGIIDIVPAAQARADEAAPDAEGSDDAPPDADPDVEELGAVDDELSVPEPADEDDARPWENREKTDADLEADRFFAAFDDTHDQPDEPQPDMAESDAHDQPDEPAADGEPEAEASVAEEHVDEPAAHEEGDER